MGSKTSSLKSPCAPLGAPRAPLAALWAPFGSILGGGGMVAEPFKYNLRECCLINSHHLDPRRKWWGSFEPGNVTKRDEHWPESSETGLSRAWLTCLVENGCKDQNHVSHVPWEAFFLASHAAWESQFAISDTPLHRFC